MEKTPEEKWLEFLETPIGKAFNAFDRHGNAWRIDTEEGYKDWANEKRVKAAWEKQSAAYKELMKLLYEAAGAGPYPE